MLAAGGYGLFKLYKYWKIDVFTAAEKPSYRHWEFITATVRIKNKQIAEAYKIQPLTAAMYRDGEKITTIGGVSDIRLNYDAKKNLWTGKWPCPWNAPDG